MPHVQHQLNVTMYQSIGYSIIGTLSIIITTSAVNEISLKLVSSKIRPISFSVS